MADEPPAPSPVEGPVAEARKLVVERVLALHLPVSVVLAERDMQLEEILRLRPGDVLEFNKRVDDPLAVVINRKTIAHGTAVKSGEKFGLRLQRILTPEETVRAMGSPA